MYTISTSSHLTIPNTYCKDLFSYQTVILYSQLTKIKASTGVVLARRCSASLLAEDELRIGSDPDCEILVDGLGVEATMCHLHCPAPRGRDEEEVGSRRSLGRV